MRVRYPRIDSPRLAAAKHVFTNPKYLRWEKHFTPLFVHDFYNVRNRSDVAYYEQFGQAYLREWVIHRIFEETVGRGSSTRCRTAFRYDVVEYSKVFVEYMIERTTIKDVLEECKSTAAFHRFTPLQLP